MEYPWGVGGRVFYISILDFDSSQCPICSPLLAARDPFWTKVGDSESQTQPMSVVGLAGWSDGFSILLMCLGASAKHTLHLKYSWHQQEQRKFYLREVPA